MNLGNVLIFGDSYSTFEGYIPEGYNIYYRTDGGATDVRAVTETWWYQLIKETDSNLVLNDSWSGSTVCHTGWYGADCSKTSSFNFRLNKYIQSGFFKENKIDTVFVFGATNDSWIGVPLGELKFSDFKEEELFSFLPAVSCFLKTLRETLPDARIVYIVNSGLQADFEKGIKKASEQYGIQTIEVGNIDKESGHPTVKGMTEIKNVILKEIE